MTDNGFEFGNTSIRQAYGWGLLSYKLYQYGISKRLFVASHAGGDSARNFIERFWTKVYKPLVGLCFPDEPESIVKIKNILERSGLNCSMAETVAPGWLFQCWDSAPSSFFSI